MEGSWDDRGSSMLYVRPFRCGTFQGSGGHSLGATFGGQILTHKSSFPQGSTGESSTSIDHRCFCCDAESYSVTSHGVTCRRFCLDLNPAPNPIFVSLADFK